MVITNGVTLHANPLAAMILARTDARVLPLCKKELDQEWLSLDLNLCIVKDIDEAIAHIRCHGTGHSDGTLTQNRVHAERFTREIDAAALYINASTRFTDGTLFGLGTEMAISTQKFHVRCPMWLEALTTIQWVGKGSYLVRS